MWLLNAHTFKLKHVAQEDGFRQRYAILSHTWADDEVTFQEVKKGSSAALNNKKGFAKIRNACRQAIADELDYVWVDTACINKTDSAELSEAINSMYRWYYHAKVCYAYLADIPKTHRRSSSGSGGGGGGGPTNNSDNNNNMSDAYLAATQRLFTDCRWVSRSWTLQELIASPLVQFFNEGWHSIGSKASLVRELAAATGIDERVLADRDTLQSFCIARRLSWAAKRESTRKEDQAYALLGICDVHIPMLYGEGGTRAFIRLQEEIMRTSVDHSIFAWEPDPTRGVPAGTLFAPSPHGFRQAGSMLSWAIPERDESFALSNQGLHIALPTIRRDDELKAILNCRYAGEFLRPLALRLSALPQRIIAPAKLADNTVCHVRPVFDPDKHGLSHLTTASLNDLHATKWLDLVIARQKPTNDEEEASGRAEARKWKKVLVQGTPSFPTFRVLYATTEGAWDEEERIMRLPVQADGQTRRAQIVFVDRLSGESITLAFTQVHDGDGSLPQRQPPSTLRYCLLSHDEYEEPWGVAAMLLENEVPAEMRTVKLPGDRRLGAKVQHMFLMGEMVWLILLTTA